SPRRAEGRFRSGRADPDAGSARAAGHRRPPRALPATPLPAGGEQGRRARGAALRRAHPRRVEARATGAAERGPEPDRAHGRRASGARAACTEPVAALPTTAHLRLPTGKLMPRRAGPYSRTAEGWTALAPPAALPVAHLPGAESAAVLRSPYRPLPAASAVVLLGKDGNLLAPPVYEGNAEKPDSFSEADLQSLLRHAPVDLARQAGTALGVPYRG